MTIIGIIETKIMWKVSCINSDSLLKSDGRMLSCFYSRYMQMKSHFKKDTTQVTAIAYRAANYADCNICRGFTTALQLPRFGNSQIAEDKRNYNLLAKRNKGRFEGNAKGHGKGVLCALWFSLQASPRSKNFLNAPELEAGSLTFHCKNCKCSNEGNCCCKRTVEADEKLTETSTPLQRTVIINWDDGKLEVQNKRLAMPAGVRFASR